MIERSLAGGPLLARRACNTSAGSGTASASITFAVRNSEGWARTRHA
jgi:hypothetical protein